MPILSNRTRKLLSIFRPIRLPLTLLVYTAVFHWAYANWIAPIWGPGEGLLYQPAQPSLLLLGYVLASALSLISPSTIRRPSQCVYWLLYLSVYVPGLLVPLFVHYQDTPTLLAMQVSLTAGMCILALWYRLPLLPLRQYPLKRGAFFAIFAVIYVVFNADILIVFRNSLNFASLDTMYQMRYQETQLLESGAIGVLTGYLLMAMIFVLNPLLLLYAIAQRRWLLVCLTMADAILMYMVHPTKFAFLNPFVIVVCYYTLRAGDGRGWVTKLNYLWAALASIPAAAALLGVRLVGKSPVGFFGFLFLIRNAAIPGLFFAQYQQFFTYHPHTYLGHVHGINLLFPYQYQLPLGMEIGNYFHGSDSKLSFENNNASFFVTDGIAGFGIFGMVIMAPICAAVLWLYDSCSQKESLPFAAAALVTVAASLTNVSLFTTLLSNGLAMWMILMLLLPREFSTRPLAPESTTVSRRIRFFLGRKR